MRFIEIKENFSISIDSIEAVERDTDLTSKIHTRFSTFIANFPYLILLRIIERETEETKETKETKVMQKLSGVLDSVGHFAG